MLFLFGLFVYLFFCVFTCCVSFTFVSLYILSCCFLCICVSFCVLVHRSVSLYFVYSDLYILSWFCICASFFFPFLNLNLCVLICVSYLFLSVYLYLYILSFPFVYLPQLSLILQPSAILCLSLPATQLSIILQLPLFLSV